MKLIEVICDSGHLDTLAGLAEQHKLVDHWHAQTDDGQRTSFRMLVDDETRQPILDTLQGLLGSGMGKGPALALLLAGPALSLPNMLVIQSVIGVKKTVVYISLVVVMATISGMIFGLMFGQEVHG